MSEYIIKEEMINTLIGLAKPNGFSISFIGEVVSAPEIVRCKDCKHKGVITDCAGISQLLCKRNEQVAFVIEHDGFCKWGERNADNG